MSTTAAKLAGRKASHLAIVAITVFSLFAVVVVREASSAHASASGCSAWGAKTVGNIPIAKGVYCVNLNGSGTYVNTVAGSYNAAGSVCNWNITAEFFDSYGKWYQTVSGPMHWGCSWQGNDAIGLFKTVKRGTMCSTLKQNGARIQSVCHSIY